MANPLHIFSSLPPALLLSRGGPGRMIVRSDREIFLGIFRERSSNQFGLHIQAPPKPRKNALVLFKKTRCLGAISFGRPPPPLLQVPCVSRRNATEKPPKPPNKKIALVLFKGTGGLGAKSFGNPPPSLPSLMAYIYKWPPPPPCPTRGLHVRPLINGIN